MKHHAHVVIIGGGILGWSIAYYLAQRDCIATATISRFLKPPNYRSVVYDLDRAIMAALSRW